MADAGMDANRSDRDLGLPPLGPAAWSTRRHAFSLPAERHNQTRAHTGATRGWRCVFGELWSELALQSAVSACEPRRTSADVLHDARVITAEARRQLGWLLAMPAGAAQVAPPLRCAAAVLEACATLWRAFGSAAGDRHVHLLRRLEERLADTERERMCAERGHDIPAVSAARASHRARRA